MEQKIQGAIKLHQEGRLAEAEVIYREILQLDPNNPSALNLLGLLANQAGFPDTAITLIQHAILIKPDYAEAHNNLGLIFDGLSKLEDAISHYGLAIQYNSNISDVYNNIAITLKKIGKFDEAIENFKKALSINPDFADAKWGLSILLLYLGNFEDGWKFYESRKSPLITERNILPSIFPQFPEWQGESLMGKSIVIWPEQGLGDEIQFCRYAPILKRHGAARITLVCKTPLKNLMQTLEGVDAVLTIEEASFITQHDYWISLLSIPLHCHTTQRTIPGTVPYLHAKQGRVADIASNLHNITAIKVGICWKGGAGYKNDADRSPGIAPFQSLFKLSGVRFFTLIPGTRSELINAAGAVAADIGHEIDELTPPFEETAALIMNLDLVITCDTSIGHLAGALGKPVWTVLPFVADWRWMTDREDSDWYPNTRLYRQTRRGDWNEVFERVSKSIDLKYIQQNPSEI